MRIRHGIGALIVLALLASLATALFARIPRGTVRLPLVPSASRAPWPLWAHGETHAVAASDDAPQQPAAAMASSRTTERQGADLGAIAPEDEARLGAPAIRALAVHERPARIDGIILAVPTPPPRFVLSLLAL